MSNKQKIILTNVDFQEILGILPKNVVLIETEEENTYKYFRLNKRTMEALRQTSEECTPYIFQENKNGKQKITDETKYLMRSKENYKRIKSALKGGKGKIYKNLDDFKRDYDIKQCELEDE